MIEALLIGGGLSNIIMEVSDYHQIGILHELKTDPPPPACRRQSFLRLKQLRRGY